MLYRAWIGLLSFCVIFTVVGIVDSATSLPYAAAQTAQTPLATVDAFYTWYLEYTTPDAEGYFNNPLSDGAYRESPYLSPDLIAAVDALKAEQGGFHADPFLCAQDVPANIFTELIREDANRAEVLVQEQFGLALHHITAHVVLTDSGWLIDSILCAETATPGGVVETFYRDYIAVGQYDEAAGGRGNPLLEGAYRSPLLADDLIAGVDALVAAGELHADPLLCAQDIPAGFEVAAQENGSYLVNGLFPGGPETFSAYSLAEVRGVETLTGWDITSISCMRR